VRGRLWTLTFLVKRMFWELFLVFKLAGQQRHCEGRTTFDVGLFKDPPEMCRYRPMADIECQRDLFVGQSLGCKSRNFQLAGRQDIL